MRFSPRRVGTAPCRVSTSSCSRGDTPGRRVQGVRIVNDDPREILTALKAKPGRDIWLYGGGTLFRSLLDRGLVDTVELAVVPVLLGAGIPLLPRGVPTKLRLADQKTLPASGIVALWSSVPWSSEYSLHQVGEDELEDHREIASGKGDEGLSGRPHDKGALRRARRRVTRRTRKARRG